MGRAWKSVLGLIAVVVPVVAHWQKVAAGHSLVAVVVAYAVAGGGWLFWRLLGPHVTRALDTRGGSLWAAIERFLSPYARNYRRWIRQNADTVDAKGLITVGPFSPRLDEVYVDLALVPRSPGQIPAGLLPGGGREQAQPRRQIGEFVNQHHRVVLAVLGAPGSGKTTLLSHVARHTADRRRKWVRPVPVLLQLRDQAAAVTADPGIGLAAMIRRAVPPSVGAEPDGWWEGRLRAGKCVVLLDGLDEVAGTDERLAVVRWVNKKVEEHPRNDFVVTSRPYGYRDTYVRATVTVQVLPFTPVQISDFLHGWYRAAERQAAGRAGFAEADRRAAEAAEHLVRRLAVVPGLHDLMVNPLLLTMIANVHRFGGQQLPASRAALYREVCDVMLWRRDRDKGRPLEPDGPHRLELLGRLAFAWMSAGVRDRDRRDLLAAFRPWLSELAPAVSAERFLAEMEASGLLQESGPDEIAFAHQTFQEYLAARYLREHDMAQVLVDAVDDVWWRETTLLFAAEDDADPIVISALCSGSPAALSLAFEIVESGAQVSPPLRGRLAEVLREGMGPASDRNARRVSADVLLGRLLRTMVVTRDGGRVGRRPVTEDLYRLFLADTGTPAPDGPAHDDPDAPARGMRRGDVLAFLAWVDTLVASGPRGGQGIRLRPPKVAELALIRPTRPVWIADLTVWNPPPPITSGDLVEAMSADLAGSELLTYVLRQVVHREATAVRVAAVRASALAGQMLDSVRVRPGPASTGREAAREAAAWRGMSAMNLRDGVNGLLKAAQALVAVLIALPERHPASVDRLERTIRKLPLREIRNAVDLAIVESVTPGDMWLRQVESLLHAAEDQLAQARRLLSAPPPAARFSPLDATLAPVAALHIRLDIPDEHGDDLAVTVASALMPRQYRRDFPDDLDEVAAAFARRPAPQSLSPQFTEVFRRVREVALPAMTRRRPMTFEDGARVRVPALILARAVQKAGDTALAAALLDVAAAMCLLDRRHRAPDTLETLILADG